MPDQAHDTVFGNAGNRAIFHDGWVAAGTRRAPVTLPVEGARHQAAAGTSSPATGGTVQRDGRSTKTRISRRRCLTSSSDAEHLLSRGGEVERSVARQHDTGALERAEAEPDGRAHRYLSGTLASVPGARRRTS